MKRMRDSSNIIGIKGIVAIYRELIFLFPICDRFLVFVNDYFFENSHLFVNDLLKFNWIKVAKNDLDLNFTKIYFGIF